MSASKYDDTFVSVLFDKLEKSIRPFYQGNRTFVLQPGELSFQEINKIQQSKVRARDIETHQQKDYKLSSSKSQVKHSRVTAELSLE